MTTADEWVTTFNHIRELDAASRHDGLRQIVNLHVGESQMLSDILQDVVIDAGCFVVDDSDGSTTWYIPVERVTAVTTVTVKVLKREK